jgi:hypothetical protein
MTLAEILQKISGLSPEERAAVRRELDEMMSKHEMSAAPETLKAIKSEQRADGDERGIPIEDVMEKPKPKDRA